MFESNEIFFLDFRQKHLEMNWLEVPGGIDFQIDILIGVLTNPVAQELN